MSIGCLVPEWPVPACIRAFATTRVAPGRSAPPFDRCNLGGRSGDDPEIVAANRQALAIAIAAPSLPVWLSQIHGAGVLEVVEAPAEPRAFDQEPAFDAAVTATRGVVLAVLAADCLPVLLAASDGSAVGVAHAGWRGLSAGVIEQTVGRLNTTSSAVIAWLGPAIGPESYEVGDEVRSAFVDVDAGTATAFAPSRLGHWHCDLYALARRRLARIGVDRVFGAGFDTLGDPQRFYSHRRDGARSGRQATLIWIERDS